MTEMSYPVNHLLAIHGLHILKSSAPKPLLDNISVFIQAGDRISLEGGSGSGKSLLLRSITQLEILNQGEFIWKGKPIHKADIPLYRSHVIYLHQRPSLGAGTVEDSLRQVLTLKIHQGKKFSESMTAHYLAEIGLDKAFLHKGIHNLSGGEAQITALLRAIQLKPEILLLDEPTAALDAEKAAVIEKIIDCWFAEAPENRAYVWVTHNMDQAARVSNKAWKMVQGKLSISY
jgi:putative ABC transport system ATP-binding protein